LPPRGSGTGALFQVVAARPLLDGSDFDHKFVHDLRADFPRPTGANGDEAAQCNSIRAAIMLRAQQETTMFKHETLNSASDLLTDDQLEVVSGGDIVDGNIPICPPIHPVLPSHPGVTFPVTNPIK
jgi:hypothetical protein